MSRFVSAGTIGSNGEPAAEVAPKDTQQAAKNTEWEAVEKELEAERARREEQRRKAVTGEEKSLYEILEANKAAKQAAFEEASKVRNQFRALDDDEIEFLDEVREKKRLEENRMKCEMEEGLKAFREAQKGPDVKVEEPGGKGEMDDWGTGRKRKRVRESQVKGVKRKVSEGEGTKEMVAEETKKDERGDTISKAKSAAAKETKSALGLVDYGSDSDDE